MLLTFFNTKFSSIFTCSALLLKIQLIIHVIILPYLYAFYFYFIKYLINFIAWDSGLFCSNCPPFVYPYYERLFCGLLALMYLKIYLNSVLITKVKMSSIYILMYFILAIFFLFFCSYYSVPYETLDPISYQPVLVSKVNLILTHYVFFYCLISFFLLEFIFIFLFTIPFFGGCLLLIFFCVGMVPSFNYLHFTDSIGETFRILIENVKAHFIVDCMNTGSDSNREALSKGVIERTAEYMGDYSVEQKRVACTESEGFLRFRELPDNKCVVTVRQCLPEEKLAASIESGLKNNIPNTLTGGFTDAAIGTPARQAAMHGIETNIHLSESKCRELILNLNKSIAEYKKK